VEMENFIFTFYFYLQSRIRIFGKQILCPSVRFDLPVAPCGV
jgi:hypothetical protein